MILLRLRSTRYPYSTLIISIFFFNDTATTEIYTLSLHDALPIFRSQQNDIEPAVLELLNADDLAETSDRVQQRLVFLGAQRLRSEEHTSELQSRQYLV